MNFKKGQMMILTIKRLTNKPDNYPRYNPEKYSQSTERTENTNERVHIFILRKKNEI